MAPTRQAHLDAYGVPLGELLRVYVRLFSKRPDVRVLDKKLATRTTRKEAVRWRENVPAHVLALCEHVGPGHFRWVYTDTENDHDHDHDSNGGRLLLRGLKLLGWRSRPADHDSVTYEMDAAFDELNSYGSAMMSYEPGEPRTDARIVFFDYDAGERIDYDTAEFYLTQGARRAFMHTWQLGDNVELNRPIERLLATSLDPDTPREELVAALVARRAGQALVDPGAVANHHGPPIVEGRVADAFDGLRCILDQE